MEPPESKRRPAKEAPSIAGERVDGEILDDGAGGINGDAGGTPRAISAEADVRAHIAVLGISPSRPHEIRVTGFDGLDARASGNFDDPEAAVAAVLAVPQRSHGVYATVNPMLAIPPGRARNVIQKHPARCTSDDEVEHRSHIYIDLDPTRTGTVAATDEEKAAARALARDVFTYLSPRGIEPVAAIDSGNGFSLLIRVDLPAKDNGLVTRFLEALAFRFDTAAAHVDRTVYNAARIHRIAGTMNRKGDDTPDRPHRRAKMLYVKADAAIASVQALEAVAAAAPPPKRGKSTGPDSKLDVRKLLNDNGIAVRRESPWKDGYRYVLEVCQFDATHTDKSAFVLQFADGGVEAGCHHNSCRGKRWKEFNATLRFPAPEQPSDGFAGSSKGPPPNSWPEPAKPPDGLPGVAPFKPDLLPERLRTLVADVSERMQCPPDYVAVAVVVSLAAALGRRIAIRPKGKDDWTVYPNLWGCVVGRPGVLKTPSIREPMQALQRLEARAREQYRKDLEAYELKAMLADERQKDAARQIRERIKDGSSDTECVDGLKLEKPTAPIRKRYLVNDSTVEKLGELLNQNPNGLLMFRDELIGWIRGLDKEGQEGARSFFLEAWDGGGSFTYDRIGRGTVDIENAIVSVLGSIQPGPLHQYVAHAVAEGIGDDGLLQRLQLTVWPDIKPIFVNIDRQPNLDARNSFVELVERLTNVGAAEVLASIDISGPRPVFFLHFAADAQLAFNAWREALETRIRSGGDHPAIESHLSKYRSLVPSLALIFHLADGGTGPVTLAALEFAFRWAAYLESHARRVFSPVLNPDAGVVRALAAKLLERKLNSPFALRDVYTKGWSNLGTQDDVQRATDVLVDLDWLHEQVEKTQGAPRRRLWINPRIYELKDPMPRGTAAGSEDAPPSSQSSDEPQGDGGQP